MVKMVEITSKLIPNPVKMVEIPLPHGDESYSPMLVRSTTGGPVFVSPDKSGGDVADVTAPPRWFMNHEIYAVKCS